MFKSERGCRKQCLLVPNVPASNSFGYPFCQTILPDDTCWGSDSEARPADETANCRWRRAPVFARAKGPQQKPAKRKRMPQTLRNAEVPSAAARSCKTLKVEGISHLSRQIEEENNSQRA